MHFPPGARPGTLASMEQAVAHLSSENNLGRVDQGPINFRWKHGAGGGKLAWRWQKQLFGVRDASGKRLCGLINGTSVGGVLPSAQFCNTLTHSVLQLWRAVEPPVGPFAVHATWMRQQREEFKRMRLREVGLWRDAPSWYGYPRGAVADATGAPLERGRWRDDLGNSDYGTTRASAMGGSVRRPRGFLSYTPRVRPELLAVRPMGYKGGIPIHHLTLMHEQLRQLRNALFIARALNRALILPHTICTCELGFFPYHIETNCRAHDHPTMRLPYNCSIDHYLDPLALDASPFAHRERTFLDNPRTSPHLVASAVRVRVSTDGDGAGDERRGGRHSTGDRVLSIPPAPTVSSLRSLLGNQPAPLLVVEDALSSFGGWDLSSAAATRELVSYHEDAQALLSSWCCTDDKRFKRLAGVIPYILPPLEGQQAWRGRKGLRWASSALAEVFEAANDTRRAAEVQPADGAG